MEGETAEVALVREEFEAARVKAIQTTDVYRGADDGLGPVGDRGQGASAIISADERRARAATREAEKRLRRWLELAAPSSH